jgi:hypothetical protein
MDTSVLKFSLMAVYDTYTELHTNQIAFHQTDVHKMKLNSLAIFQTDNVDRHFLNSINRAFSKFGENRAELVFSKFESEYNLSRTEIFQKPELFSKIVRNIFRFGSKYIERAIIAEIRYDFSLPMKDYKVLSDVVAEIRKSRISTKN